MRHRILLHAMFILGLSQLSCKKSEGPLPEGTAIDPKTLFARGINLSNWFNDYSDAAQFGTRFNASHFTQIKQLGFTFVRLPIGNTVLYDPTSPGTLKSSQLAWVDSAVKHINTSGLAVIIDFHPQQAGFEEALGLNTGGEQDGLVKFWKALADHYKSYPADKLAFEVYNEPHVTGVAPTVFQPDWWLPVQGRCIQAIRSVTLAHFVIAGGMEWNSMNGLVRVSPYPYDRVVYNFHFYDPFLFTHQGASWVDWPPAKEGHDIPWPASPEGVAPLIASASSPSVKDALAWYGDNRFNADSVNRWISKASDWATRNQVYVMCNEFGSYKAVAPTDSRIGWIHDVRTALESHGIGWAMWEYDEGFGLVTYPTGDRSHPVVDDKVRQALGL